MRARATTWSAQLSWRSPPRLSRWRRCLPLEASTGLVPASAAKDASLLIRPGSPLETSSWAPQTGPTPDSSSRVGATSATTAARCALGLCHLSRESLHAPAEPSQDAVHDLG